MSKDFGKRLKYVRLSAGLSQAGLAHKIDVRRSTVNKWENEPKIEPGARAIRRAAKVLETTEEYLLYGQSGDGVKGGLSREIERKMAQHQELLNRLQPIEQKERLRRLEFEFLEIKDLLKKRADRGRRQNIARAGSRGSPAPVTHDKEEYID